MTVTQTGPQSQHHPVVSRMHEHRAADLQLKIADMITKFAGSMAFVYLHMAGFGIWMAFAEASPWPTLTLVVSLEAIFLSTFVMISQNRADAKHQVVADQQWRTVQDEDKQNEELLDLSRQILELTKAVHAYATARAEAAAPTAAHPSGDDARPAT